jgi:pimeloyl-ACP methyl ester carboxylesterase
MTPLFADLRQLAAAPPPPAVAPDNALIFVHGIFSSHLTFQPLLEGLMAKPALAKWRPYFFDYNFRQPIPASGKELADLISKSFPAKKTDITIIGHSMGGLVARAALLQAGDMAVVKRLVMLGTPNHGTLHSARLGALAYLLREESALLSIVFPRIMPGVNQLTQIGKTMRPLLRQGVERTRNVEYVSIPGLRYNEESGWLELPEKTSRGLRALTMGMAFIRSLPGMHMELSLPHDGIVEESCVRLSSTPDRFSERPNVGLGVIGPAPYLHITHPDYESVDHVTVQQTRRTIELLADLLQTPDLKTWRAKLAGTGEFNLFP